ncbi:hypothetical protein AB0G79_27800 [Streptomyces sp. NPDC020807]|uniref:hypothetical protein n=1 Tax=Streptomyces sp. NPDC020807 TaxID=3155119 RepID=UPI0033E169EE
MKRTKMRLTSAAIGATIALSGATTASAYSYFVIYHGNDYSITYGGNTGRAAISACDNELDGNEAYALYVRKSDSYNSPRRVEDGTGADGVCVDSGSSDSNYITNAKTCENIAFYPDACSPWRF